MNNKMMTALGSLLLATAAIAPGVFAHTEGTNPAWMGAAPSGSSATNPGGFYYGAVSAYAGLTANDVGGPAPSECAQLPDPAAVEACENLLGPQNPGFLFAAANAFCDLEVLSDGDSSSADDNMLDETQVDGTTTVGMLPDGLFNDGGIGAVCHTSADADNTVDPVQEGYYADDASNTPGCGSGSAFANDAVSGGNVWLSTSCDFTSDLTGPGLLGSFQGCVVGAVLTTEVGDLTGCVNLLVGCLGFGTGCPLPGTTQCGADHSADVSGGFGRGGAGVPYPAAPYEDSSAHDCVDYSAAAAFVWNGVDVVTNGSSPVADSTVSVATFGWVA